MPRKDKTAPRNWLDLPAGEAGPNRAPSGEVLSIHPPKRYAIVPPPSLPRTRVRRHRAHVPTAEQDIRMGLIGLRESLTHMPASVQTAHMIATIDRLLRLPR